MILVDVEEIHNGSVVQSLLEYCHGAGAIRKSSY